MATWITNNWAETKGSASTSKTFTFAGATVGNLLVCSVSARSGGQNLISHPGWELAHHESDDDGGGSVFYRVATGSDDLVVTWGSSATAASAAVEIDATVVDVSVIGSVITAQNQSGLIAGASSLDTGNITPASTDDKLLVSIIIKNAGSWMTNVDGTGISYTNSFVHEIAGSSLGNNPGAVISSREAGDAGPINCVATTSVGTSKSYNIIIALKGVGGSPVDTLTFNDIANNSVIQRSGQSGRPGGSGTVPVSGTYSGPTTPTSIEARVLLASDGTTEVKTWSTVDPSPTGGTFSGQISGVDASKDSYILEVRSLDGATPIVTKTGTNTWAVGSIVLVCGASRAVRWFTDGGGNTPDASLRQYGDSGWEVVTGSGNGRNVFGNYWVNVTGVALAQISAGVTNVALLPETPNAPNGYWLDETGGQPYPRALGFVNATGGALEAVVFGVGGNEARNDTTVAANKAGLVEMVNNRFRRDMANSSSQAELPICYIIQGQDASVTGTPDSGFQAVRRAYTESATDLSNVTHGSHTMDQDLDADLKHLVPAGYSELALRCAYAFDNVYNELPYRLGPSFTSAQVTSDTTVDLVMTHEGGSDFTPTSGIQGITVTDDDWATNKTVTAAVRKNATTVTVTVSETISGTCKVRHLYGAAPYGGSPTGPLQDNTSEVLPVEPIYDELTAAPLATKTVTLTFTNAAGAPEANLTGLKWAWFDEVTPDLFTTPTDQGTGETTDASGVITIDIPNSTKTSGQVGWISVTDSDGTVSTFKGYAGPAAID